MRNQNSTAESLDWTKSILWMAFAVVCFHGAYTSIHFPVIGLLIFGYAYGLVRLTVQPNVRRAFYFGLATGYLCYAPQLFFMWRIFSNYRGDFASIRLAGKKVCCPHAQGCRLGGDSKFPAGRLPGLLSQPAA
jgi:hypothetical protein